MRLKSYLTSIGARGQNILGVLQNAQLTKKQIEICIDDPLKPQGITIRVTSPRLRIYMCSENADFALEYVNSFPSGELLSFSGVEHGLAQKVQQYIDLQRVSVCDAFFYPSKKLPVYDGPYKAVAIDPKDIETINSFYTYRGDFSLAQITEEVTNRDTSAVYVDGQIASWALIHFDNSMGTMFTLPEYRKMGLAVAVTERLVRCLLQKDILPFVHIDVTNTASLGLAAKNKLQHFGQYDFFGGTVKVK